MVKYILFFHWFHCQKKSVRTSPSRRTGLFRIRCSQVDWLKFLLTHSRSVKVHLPVEAQRPSTSMELHRTAFFSASKGDGHWIMLRLCPSDRCSASLGVNGGVGFCVMIGGSAKDWVAVWLTANYKTLLELSSFLSPIPDFASESKGKLQPNYWYLLGEIAR